VTAIAGFIGSVNLANEVARLLLEAWPDEVAGPLATEIHHVLTTPHGARRLGETPSDEALQLAISEQLSVNRVPVFLCDSAPKGATK
jgi:hypothetical protein